MEISNVKRECNITINGKTVEGGNLTNVPMNSPECIKKKLNGYSARYLSGNNWGREILGTGEIMHNAFFYIQQLESRLAQVERERDAAVRAISDAQHYIKNLGAVQYGLQQLENWDYSIKKRGLCPENSKEETDATVD